MKKTALLALVSIAVASPSMAKSYHHHGDHRASSRHRDYAEGGHHHHAYAERVHRRIDAEKPSASPSPAHAGITCEMVRAYVAQVGVVQARAMALSAGMTAEEERRAKHCLQSGA
jgi:hypothetical protein